MAMVLKSHSISDVISENMGGNIRGEGGLDFSQVDFLFDADFVFLFTTYIALMLCDALYYCPTAEIGTMDFLCKAHTRLLN